MDNPETSWRAAKFGDVVRQVKDKVDPRAGGVERFVAGEHMDSDDLRLWRWGEVGDDYLGPAFHMRFKPGQVLYGSRRTYLRKVAVAGFEGVCANTTFVLESRDPNLLRPELLPFVMTTERFHEHSVKQSKGSVNPYVNFSDLAWFEFALPPAQEQARFASVLQSIESARAFANTALQTGKLAFEALVWNATTGVLSKEQREPVRNWRYGRLPGVETMPSSWSLATLTNVARLESGHTPSKRREDYWNGGVPWISLADIKRLGRPEIAVTEHEIADLGLQNSSARLLPPGTVVLSRTAMIGYTSVMAREMATSQDFANFVCNESRLLPRYLFYVFSAMREYFSYIAIGSSNVNTIYMPFFQRMQFLLPPPEEQARLVELLDEVWEGLVALRERIESHSSLLHCVREELLGREG